MAIKSLKIKRRMQNLATARTTEVAVADFRSLEEIKEYLKALSSEFVGFEKRVNSLKEFFLKHNAQRRINKTLQVLQKQRKEDMQAASVKKGKETAMDFDAEKFMKQYEKYGPGATGLDPQMLKTFDSTSDIDDKKRVPVHIGSHDYQLIRKNFMGVEDWEEKLESLDVITALLKTKFKSVPGASAVQKMIDVMYGKIDTTCQKAYKFLEKVAKQLAPAAFTDTLYSTLEKLEEKYEGKYFDSLDEPKIYLTADERTIKKTVTTKSGKTKEVEDVRYDLKFVAYVKLNELQDSSGSYEKDVYLIYIAVVDMERMMMTMFVTFSERFISPQRVKYGRQVFWNEDSCWRSTLATLVSGVGLKELKRMPWPEEKKGQYKQVIQQGKYGQFVSYISVDENEELVIDFNEKIKSQAQAKEIGDKIRQDIQLTLIAMTKQRVGTNFYISEPSGDDDTYKAHISLEVPVGYVRDEKVERKIFERLQRLGIPITDEVYRQLVLLLNY